MSNTTMSLCGERKHSLNWLQQVILLSSPNRTIVQLNSIVTYHMRLQDSRKRVSNVIRRTLRVGEEETEDKWSLYCFQYLIPIH